MKPRRDLWPAAGLVAGIAGLLMSYFVAMVMTIRDSPLVAIAELVIRWTPGPVAEKAIKFLGHQDKAFLIVMILLITGAVFAWTGRAAQRTWWLPVVVYSVLALIGGGAVLSQHNASTIDLVPVAAGYVTWTVCLSLLTEPLRRGERASEIDASTPGSHTRRTFMLRAGLMVGAGVVLGAVGRVVGAGRRHVEETRRLLKLTGITPPVVPEGARLGVDGVTAWETPSDTFYQIHTAIVVPAIEPSDWTLRIHGMVDREIVLTYDDLLARQLTEAWITLNCVSNPVGGDLIGNAWWSGVRIAPLLAEAGVQAGADAVLQTSDDGWTCGTPLDALTDDRDAMLAVAMNGRPLPIDHGFPVRTIVPGLYGYVSGTKWVRDFEVTRFADFEAYWTQRGWGERGPVKIASRVDVPRSGETVTAGEVRFGGVAWCQHVGISGVEISVDGGDWITAEIGASPSADTWVQWTATAEVGEGDHLVAVRAIDGEGEVQTSEEADVLPDGATGLHVRDFTAQA
ncbi:MAG: molybdopterin-dependent oxidoreductase [Actinobacteria bacterium]|uniref:Unannotated protein n=1 Tax=freshwater metagenome TaxID=449393 RepID=A0A6J6PZT5_9ZZZZ|nr:molybdopterin-dependent oxidoreductase [Actinomycetota bacterium]